MPPIPLYIVEEHHEALWLWHQCIQEGILPREGNTLLHIDEHSDMALPAARCDMRKAFESPDAFREFVYGDLHVGSFLYPAIYLGIFNRVYWMRRQHDPELDTSILSVKSLRGEGRVLERASVSDPADLFNEDRRAFRLTHATDSQSLKLPDAPVVLDIDLDYFSCNNEVGESWRIEVTREAYQSYVENPYDKTRLATGGVLRPAQEGEAYYLIRSYESQSLKESQESILQHIRSMADFLKRNDTQPVLINISRSRWSGYTPADQWEFIEANVLSTLADLFPISVTSCGK